MQEASRNWCFMLVSCLAYSSTLKIGVTCSSEMLVDFQRIARHYIPENITLEDLKTTFARVNAEGLSACNESATS
jgi:hypothetical protein